MRKMFVIAVICFTAIVGTISSASAELYPTKEYGAQIQNFMGLLDYWCQSPKEGAGNQLADYYGLPAKGSISGNEGKVYQLQACGQGVNGKGIPSTSWVGSYHVQEYRGVDVFYLGVSYIDVPKGFTHNEPANSLFVGQVFTAKWENGKISYFDKKPYVALFEGRPFAKRPVWVYWQGVERKWNVPKPETLRGKDVFEKYVRGAFDIGLMRMFPKMVHNLRDREPKNLHPFTIWVW